MARDTKSSEGVCMPEASLRAEWAACAYERTDSALQPQAGQVQPPYRFHTHVARRDMIMILVRRSHALSHQSLHARGQALSQSRTVFPAMIEHFADHMSTATRQDDP